MDRYWPSLVTLILGILTVLANTYIVRMGRKQQDAQTEKLNAEARDQTIQTARGLMEELRKDLVVARENIVSLQDANKKLTERADFLEDTNRKLVERVNMLEEVNRKLTERADFLEQESSAMKVTILEQAEVIEKQSRRISEQDKVIRFLQKGVKMLGEQISARNEVPVFTLGKE